MLTSNEIKNLKLAISSKQLVKYSGLGLKCFAVSKDIDGTLRKVETENDIEILYLVMLGNYFLGVKNELGRSMYFDVDLNNKSIVKVVDFESEA